VKRLGPVLQFDAVHGTKLRNYNVDRPYGARNVELLRSYSGTYAQLNFGIPSFETVGLLVAALLTYG